MSRARLLFSFSEDKRKTDEGDGAANHICEQFSVTLRVIVPSKVASLQKGKGNRPEHQRPSKSFHIHTYTVAHIAEMSRGSFI